MHHLRASETLPSGKKEGSCTFLNRNRKAVCSATGGIYCETRELDSSTQKTSRKEQELPRRGFQDVEIGREAFCEIEGEEKELPYLRD